MTKVEWGESNIQKRRLRVVEEYKSQEIKAKKDRA